MERASEMTAFRRETESHWAGQERTGENGVGRNLLPRDGIEEATAKSNSHVRGRGLELDLGGVRMRRRGGKDTCGLSEALEDSANDGGISLANGRRGEVEGLRGARGS